MTTEQKHPSVCLHFAADDLASGSRVLSSLYTGYYDDETLPVIASPAASTFGKLTNTANGATHYQNRCHANKPSKQPFSPIPVEDETAQPKNAAPALQNLQVFRLANVLKVMPLKAMAQKIPMARYHTSFLPLHFGPALTLVYDCTNNSARDLRTALTQLCPGNLEELKRPLGLLSLAMHHASITRKPVPLSVVQEKK